jgi:hypothetical protein
MAVISAGYSQDTAKPAPAFKLSGSADAYYRFNFNNPSTGVNSFTSFTNTQNSFELGMASIRADHSFGKASVTADLGFGKRAEEFSYTDVPGTFGFSLANVKQLYVTYAPSDKLKFTMGKWATHVGYELVDAYLNRNYSMSYMFSKGPFFHTGIKADISLGGTSAFMVGVTNPTDYSTTTSTSKFAIAQFSTATSDSKVKFYLNYQGGKVEPGVTLHQGDVVITGAVSDKFSIGYNGTVQTRKPSGKTGDSWWGSALYFNIDPTSFFGLTLRTEYFSDNKNVVGVNSKVFENTLSANFKVSNLTIIPELRLDNASTPIFVKNDGSGTKSTMTALLAAVYSF